jgi:hypothetical protein
MALVIQLRNDITANWAFTNPILALGEFGYDSDLKQIKVGDGVTVWNSLPFFMVQISCDTTSGWAVANPTLALGQFAYDTILLQIKVGDGATPWNSLPYFMTQSMGIGNLDGGTPSTVFGVPSHLDGGTP